MNGVVVFVSWWHPRLTSLRFRLPWCRSCSSISGCRGYTPMRPLGFGVSIETRNPMPLFFRRLPMYGTRPAGLLREAFARNRMQYKIVCAFVRLLFMPVLAARGPAENCRGCSATRLGSAPFPGSVVPRSLGSEHSFVGRFGRRWQRESFSFAPVVSSRPSWGCPPRTRTRFRHRAAR